MRKCALFILALTLLIGLGGACDSGDFMEPWQREMQKTLEKSEKAIREWKIPHKVKLSDSGPPMPLGYIGFTDDVVIFEVTNEGTISHDFRIPDLRVNSGPISPGKTVTLEVITPKKAGRYDIISSGRAIGYLATAPYGPEKSK